MRMGGLIEPDTVAGSSTGAGPPPIPAASDQNARTRELTAIPMRRPPKIPDSPDRPPPPALETSGISNVLRPETSHAEDHDFHRPLEGGAQVGYNANVDNAVAFRFASGSPTPIAEHTNAEVLQVRDPAPTPIAYNGDIHWPMTDKGKNKAEPPPLGEWYKKLERAEEIQHLKDSLYTLGLPKVEVISRWGIEGARWTKGELLPARFKQKQRAAQESPLYKDGVIDIGRIEGVPGHYVYVRPKRVKRTDGTMDESATYKALESGAVPAPTGDEDKESDDGTGDVVRVPLGLQCLPHTAREMMELAERVQEVDGGRAQNMSHYPHAPLRLQFRPFALQLTEVLQRHQPGWVPTGIDTNVSRPSNTDMTLSPANRLTDRIVRRIADFYTEIHMAEALPEVPLMPLHIDQGPVHNSRLTNADKEAYKRATLRRKSFDLGRMCRSWWDGCSKGYKDVIIIGDKDAERACKNICAWVPSKELRYINLSLQMSVVSVHRVLRALIAQRPAGDAKIELNRLTILHSYAPETFPPGCGTKLENFIDQLERLEVRHLVFEAYSGDRVIDVECLDVIAQAMRRPWPRPRNVVWHADIADDFEEALINAPGGVVSHTYIHEHITAPLEAKRRIAVEHERKDQQERQQRGAAMGKYRQTQQDETVKWAGVKPKPKQQPQIVRGAKRLKQESTTPTVAPQFDRWPEPPSWPTRADESVYGNYYSRAAYDQAVSFRVAKLERENAWRRLPVQEKENAWRDYYDGSAARDRRESEVLVAAAMGAGWRQHRGTGRMGDSWRPNPFHRPYGAMSPKFMAPLKYTTQGQLVRGIGSTTPTYEPPTLQVTAPKPTQSTTPTYPPPNDPVKAAADRAAKGGWFHFHVNFDHAPAADRTADTNGVVGLAKGKHKLDDVLDAHDVTAREGRPAVPTKAVNRKLTPHNRTGPNQSVIAVGKRKREDSTEEAMINTPTVKPTEKRTVMPQNALGGTELSVHIVSNQLSSSSSLESTPICTRDEETACNARVKPAVPKSQAQDRGGKTSSVTKAKANPMANPTKALRIENDLPAAKRAKIEESQPKQPCMDDVLGYVHATEALHPHLPWSHLDKLDPAERAHRELWADLFTVMEHKYRRWTTVASTAIVKKGCAKPKEAWRIARGWIPQNPLGNQILSAMLKEWYFSLEKLEIRCAWSDLYREIRKCAKNGKLEHFDFHFVPVNRKAARKSLTKNQQRRRHIDANPPIGGLKSLDNILMWDFRFRPEKWFRQFVRYQLKKKYPDPKDPRGFWEEPAPHRSLSWTVHVPHDNWIQQLGRPHFKGLSKTFPWQGNVGDINNALSGFLTLEGFSKFDPGAQAEIEGWTDREYFQKMYDYLTDDTRVRTEVGEVKEGRIGDDPLLIAAHVTQPAKENLYAITGGAKVNPDWIREHIAASRRKQQRKAEVVAEMEERMLNEPDFRAKRDRVMVEMMRAHVEAMSVEEKEDLVRRLKRKYGTGQLFRAVNWPLRTEGYPGVTLVANVEME